MSSYAARTAVAPAATRTEIERTLSRHGASAFAYATQDVPPSAVLAFRLGTYAIRYTLPLPDPSHPSIAHTPQGFARTAAQQTKAFEQAVAARWRALALIVKAKLVAIESGVSTIETEFLAQLVLADNHTVYERLAPTLPALRSNPSTPLAIGPSPS